MTQSEKTVTEHNILSAVRQRLANGERLSEINAGTLADDLNCRSTQIETVFPDNTSILTGLLIELDRKCDAELSRHILNEQPKDRLFEAFMVRFDVLNDDREAWKNLFFDVLKNPAYLKVATARFHHSMNVMLRICDLTDRKGPALSAPFKSGAIALVYLNAIRIWLNDETPDMSQTMAELDRGLTRLDSIVSGLPSILQGWVS